MRALLMIYAIIEVYSSAPDTIGVDINIYIYIH